MIPGKGFIIYPFYGRTGQYVMELIKKQFLPESFQILLRIGMTANQPTKNTGQLKLTKFKLYLSVIAFTLAWLYRCGVSQIQFSDPGLISVPIFRTLENL